MNVDATPAADVLKSKRGGLQRISPWGCQFALDFQALVERLGQPDRYNLVLHKHLGDVVYAIATKAEFENFYQQKLRYIVRPQHEFLMEMYGVEDYAVFDLDSLVRTNTRLLEIYFGPEPPRKDLLDKLENNLFQAIFPCIPVKGRPFVCETMTDEFFEFERYWAYRWAVNMGIEHDFKFRLANRPPHMSSKSRDALLDLGPLERVVLIAPEAATASELPSEFWNVIADELHLQGYVVLVNSSRIQVRHGVPAADFALSLSDVVAVGYACAYVFALRSGICDALAGVGQRLYAFYPAMLRREGGGLNRAFDVPAHEIMIHDWRIDKVLWEGRDLTAALQQQINILRRKYEKERLLAKLGPKAYRARHLLKKTALRDLAGDGSISPPEGNVQFVQPSAQIT